MQKKNAKNKLIIGTIVTALLLGIVAIAFSIYTNILRPRNEFRIAEELYSRGEYSAAKAILESLPEATDNETLIYDCNYALSKEAMKNGNYQLAKDYLAGSGHHAQAYELQLVDILTSEIGDSVAFGSYEQDNNLSNGKEKITWTVLDSNNGEVLLLSNYNLDCVKYNDQWANTSWHECSLRKWLNDTFWESAFSSEEKKAISLTKVKNTGTGLYSILDTDDYVFVLSADEWATYALTAATPNTDYAIAQGVFNEDGFGWTWLRSEGISQDHAQEIDCTGGLNAFGSYVDCDNEGVRPAIWVNGVCLYE